MLWEILETQKILSFWVFGPKFFGILGLGLSLKFGFFGFLSLGLGLGLGGKSKFQTQNPKIFGCQRLVTCYDTSVT
jgi:hypothetical protein